MYPRKQLDIAFSDLLFGLLACAKPNDNGVNVKQTIATVFANNKHLLLSLSVRSGFDLLLSALKLPAGSEVIMTGITIPDMPKIAEKHGLNVVPIDLDMQNLQIKQAHLRQAITQRTKLIVVAHLYGAVIELDCLVDIIEQRPDILLLEDCAQVFSGPQGYLGHPKADAQMFSFGTIKTATALGGAVLHMQDETLVKRMQDLQEQWPTMQRSEYAKKLIKTFLFTLILLPPLFSLFIRYCRFKKIDYDKAVVEGVRGFKGDDLFKLIRRRPPTALLALLARRLKRFNQAAFALRTAKLHHIKKLLSTEVRIHGLTNPTHTNWLFAVAARFPERLIEQIRALKVDCTRNSTQLRALAGKDPIANPTECQTYMRDTVYIPLLNSMPNELIAKIAMLLNEDAATLVIAE
jgi:perosamine synthetase